MTIRRNGARICLWRRDNGHVWCGPRATSHGTHDRGEATCPACLRRWRLEQPPELGQLWIRCGDKAVGTVVDTDGPRTLVRYATRTGAEVERWLYNGELRRLWTVP